MWRAGRASRAGNGSRRCFQQSSRAPLRFIVRSSIYKGNALQKENGPARNSVDLRETANHRTRVDLAGLADGLREKHAVKSLFLEVVSNLSECRATLVERPCSRVSVTPCTPES
jgi:hypothetical protein